MIKVNFKEFNELNVTDENGKGIISFKKSKALPTRERYLVINANDERIGSIEKIRYNFGLVNLPEIDIKINNDKIKIKKDMQELKEFYEITGSEFSIDGKWREQFNISKSKKVLATVNVQNEEMGPTYLVDVIDKSNEEQVICILFALSWIM